jgi:hypothetical protein
VGLDWVRWVNFGQVRSEEVKSGQVKSNWTRLDQIHRINSDKVRSGQMRYGKDIWRLGERLSESEMLNDMLKQSYDEFGIEFTNGLLSR